MATDAVLKKVKHLSTQVAMHEQPSIALSHGFAWCGQQSMSSIADMSAVSVDFMAASLTSPAAGNTATEKAISTANMVRPTFIFDKVTRFGPLEVK
jgi:hypothetical protein